MLTNFKGKGCGRNHHLVWKSLLLVAKGVDASIGGKRANSESAEPVCCPPGTHATPRALTASMAPTEPAPRGTRAAAAAALLIGRRVTTPLPAIGWERACDSPG